MADLEKPRGLNINDLPNEILAHIFWLGIKNYFDEEEVSTVILSNHNSQKRVFGR